LSLKRIITLTTDFGTGDPYVAAVKGAILTINRDATIVDVSHDLKAQQIEQAVFVLSSALPYFPRNSIHIVVADPEVGTERRALALVAGEVVFIGPDNGVLSPGLTDGEREGAVNGPSAVPVPTGKRAFLLTNPRYQLSPTSATFHARDIFGPAAAHLSTGITPSSFGPGVGQITALPPFRGNHVEGGSLVGRIIHIDRFGNAITTIRGEQLPPGTLRIDVRDREIEGLSRSYAERDGLLALIGSSGFLEVALNSGSAADALGVELGDLVSVRAI
jgi:S-adenosylmethionine hydrolase